VQKNSKEIQAAIAALPPAPLTADAALNPPTAAPKTAATEKQKNAQKTAKATKATASRSTTGGLFNGKIAPLIPYAIRGILWYQGEANTTPAKASLYEHQLALLVRDWRTRWGTELPFAWVQLPNFVGAGRDWPIVREAMLKTLALPQTGMAITIDVGEANDIHPKNKQTVGHRLAQWALGSVYAQKVAATSGPLPAGHEIRGREMILRFRHAEGGLVAQGGPLTGFVVAGADRTWAPAQARLVGNTVVISAPDVAAPVAARYAWENFPTCNLYNGAGLPASPFRTDDWK
jgi:sialate O-acetylesterase